MAWSFNSQKPIFSQMVDKIIMRIFCGEYALGERMPSVRELALEAEVNPNTVQRAYQSVEEMGIIVTKRCDGRFVTENKEIIDNLKEKYALLSAEKFIRDMRLMNIKNEEIFKILRIAEERTEK